MIYATTPRLVLRDWQAEDLPSFAALNADERVMEYFLSPLDFAASAAQLAEIRDELQAEGFGIYLLERREDGRFLGVCGLHRVRMPGELNRSVEIAWRLLPEAWGYGYATEAAHACFALAAECGIAEVVAFTALPNLRSQRVMQRLGMQFDGEFDHPKVPDGHPLKRHVLYRKATR